MNQHRHGLAIALLLAFVLLVAAAVPATLAYIVVQSPSIVNIFDAPRYDAVTVDLLVEKTVVDLGSESIGPEGFQFLLRNTATGEETILTADAAGHARTSLAFTAADAGQSITYNLSEINDGRVGVTYSTAVYDIVVTVNLDATGTGLVADVSINGQAVTSLVVGFENTYLPPTALPETGDATPLMLYLLMLLSSGTMLAVLHRRRRAR